MEHYITEIQITKVRHLSDISIKLPEEKRTHLLLTGKNGSGKTSVLQALEKTLKIINDNAESSVDWNRKQLKSATERLSVAASEEERYNAESAIQNFKLLLSAYDSGVTVKYNDSRELHALFAHGNFITASFNSQRFSGMLKPNGVEIIQLQQAFPVAEDASRNLLKYMVHLKTQLAYAVQDRRSDDEKTIAQWFDRFENALKVLFDDASLQLEYDRKGYNFIIRQEGHENFGFDGLSDGYSAAIRILSDLMLRMESNWTEGNTIDEYDREGIVLIDELETHLHIELQRKILPFLTPFFPRIQFIVSTHSPYVLTSVSNAVVYDLERQVALTDLSDYSADDIAEGYFEAQRYSVELERMLDRYRELAGKEDITEDERAERSEIRTRLKNVPGQLATDISNEFEEIERRRKSVG